MCDFALGETSRVKRWPCEIKDDGLLAIVFDIADIAQVYVWCSFVKEQVCAQWGRERERDTTRNEKMEHRP